jgi:hypothetical protein
VEVVQGGAGLVSQVSGVWGGLTVTEPSWQQWPPNCCETCVGWQKTNQHVGRCIQNLSVNCGDITDSRFRCQDFVRKDQAGG